MTSSLVDSYCNRLFKTRWRTRLLLIFSGMLFPLAFAPIDFWPLAFISLIFLLIALRKNTLLSHFKLGYYWGLGSFSIGASWVYVSIHEFGYVPWLGAAALTGLFIAFLALFKGAFSYLCCRLLSLGPPSLLVLIAPAVWLFCEFLQSVVFNGFPWLLAGYSQIDSPLGSLASWLGVYGVSWFVVAIAATITLLLGQKKQPVYWTILIGLAGVILIVGILNKQTEAEDNQAKQLDVALVQPNIAQEKKWNRNFFTEIIDILVSETEPLWSADIIIWPEGAIPAYAHQVTELTAQLQQKAIENNAHLILGIPEYDSKQKRSYVALNAYGQRSQHYRKQVLVPFGEYIPLENWLRGLIQFLDLPMSNFSPPLSAQQPMLFEQLSVIPAICYEIVYPQLLRDLSKKAENAGLPQLIVTVSNDAWFGDSLGPYQHMQMARMRALELGLPLVRSTNDGITAMVDAKGNMLKQLPRYYQGSLRNSISLSNINTYYRQWGYSGVLMILLLSCVVCGITFWRCRKN